MPSPPRTAICGAGPAGLLLARLLTIHDFPFNIYESDSSPNARSQGGTLDLHPESGQRGLREAGLTDEFRKIIRHGGEAMRLSDKSGRIHIDEKDDGQGDRPEVDRVQLRRILIESVGVENISWGKKVASCRQAVALGGEDQWAVVLADGSEEGPFDLIVGADGTWSRIRPAVTDTVPHHSSMNSVQLQFTDVHKRHPAVVELIGEGTFMGLGDNGKAFFGQMNGDDSIKIYLQMRAPDSQTWIKDCGIDFSNGPEAKRLLVEKYFHDWSDDFKNLIRGADDEIIPRPLYMLPIGFRWDYQPGVTLIGDAAHVTPPSGDGVNMAMLDAVVLGNALFEGHKSSKDTRQTVASALNSYESEMFERMKGKVEEAVGMLEMMFSDDGVARTKAFFFQVMSAQGTQG